eukprot:RCo051347
MSSKRRDGGRTRLRRTSSLLGDWSERSPREASALSLLLVYHYPRSAFPPCAFFVLRVPSLWSTSTRDAHRVMLLHSSAIPTPAHNTDAFTSGPQRALCASLCRKTPSVFRAPTPTNSRTDRHSFVRCSRSASVHPCGDALGRRPPFAFFSFSLNLRCRLFFVLGVAGNDRKKK